MKRSIFWALVFSLSLVFLAHGQPATAAASTTVNCDAGQSLNTALSKLDKETPATVLVQGTCTEYVLISGFENLTVKGLPGATLVQPNTVPNTTIFVSLLHINASRSVLIDGLSFNSTSSSPPAVGVGNGSTDVRLRNLTIEGGGEGITIFGNSQVLVEGVTARNPGYTPVGVYDVSDVHIDSCLFEDSTGTPWHVGVDVSAAHVAIRRTTIRNMQVGLDARGSGVIDVVDFNTDYPGGGVSDVVIDNPAGNNAYGAWIDSGSSLNIRTAKLRITNAGHIQTWGFSSGAILISGGSTLNAGANLVVSSSQGQGVFVTNDSHATLAGSSITGSQHGGLVAVNLSTISAVTFGPATQVSGNSTDLFCDSNSMITGGSNISGASSVQCANFLPGDNVPVP